MAVLLTDRNPSNVEFLNTGLMIDERASEIYNHIPKAKWRSIGNRIETYGAEIIDQVIAGNSIYPKRPEEYWMRRKCFLMAWSTCFKLSHRIDTAQKSCNLSDKYVEEWQALLDKEIRVIRGELDSAERRYKNILG